MRLIKPDFKITKEHGQWFEKSGVSMTALYHPAAILRDPSRRPETLCGFKGHSRQKFDRCAPIPTSK